MPDLTNRDDILREVADRMFYHFARPDGVVVIPGQLGSAVNILSLAYRAACLPDTIDREVAENGKDVLLRRIPTSVKCPHCDDRKRVTHGFVEIPCPECCKDEWQKIADKQASVKRKGQDDGE